MTKMESIIDHKIDMIMEFMGNLVPRAFPLKIGWDPPIF